MGAFAALEGFNRRHPWSHNEHFHGWILRNLPQRRDSALEVGCGRGELAQKLSRLFGQVRAIDADARMVEAASRRLSGVSNVQVEQSRFLDVQGSYDAITMVTVLHHMDLVPALTHARQLLTPGGRLLVVGLTRMASGRDMLWDVASALLNPVVGFIKHPRVAAGSIDEPFPVAAPEVSFSELAATVALLLPGALLRRRLFFRHTLVWERPREV